ncbi:MAG: hypothetical protein ACTSR3_01270 [Candidatus Helarchaeota archaeon]
MNKNCPICKKRVTKKQPHYFRGGQRYHAECLMKVWNDYEEKRAFLGTRVENEQSKQDNI